MQGASLRSGLRSFYCFRIRPWTDCLRRRDSESKFIALPSAAASFDISGNRPLKSALFGLGICWRFGAKIPDLWDPLWSPEVDPVTYTLWHQKVWALNRKEWLQFLHSISDHFRGPKRRLLGADSFGGRPCSDRGRIRPHVLHVVREHGQVEARVLLIQLAY